VIKSSLKSALVPVAAAVVMGLAVMALMTFAPATVPPGQPPLTTLDAGSLPAVKAAFDAPGSWIRILVLLSPT